MTKGVKGEGYHKMIAALRLWTLRVLIAALAAGGVAIVCVVFVGMLNAELYGRLTETKEVATPMRTDKNAPVIRLIIHKILPDENSVEASVALVVPASSQLASAIKGAKATARAIVEDRSSAQQCGIAAETAILDANVFERPTADGVVTSPRFVLPADPSVASYPFDDQKVRPFLTLWTSSGFFTYKIEVQKALPGRKLFIKDEGGAPEVSLKRPAIQKAFVLVCSAVFLIVSSAVTAGFLFTRRGLSTLEQIVATASYIVAVAGFRQLLGVDKIVGTTVLEGVIIGVPLVMLCAAVAFSMYCSKQRPSISCL